jgi:hypothetical protein
MGTFCHTSVRQTVDFAAPEFRARLKSAKFENVIFNLVVKIFGTVGGAAKEVYFERGQKCGENLSDESENSLEYCKKLRIFFLKSLQ